MAASRAKQNTEIVTTEEGREEMLKNAGKEPEKTTAIDIGRNVSLDRVQVREQTQGPVRERQQERSGPELSL